MTVPAFHIPYLLPTALLFIAVALKFPTFVRAWRDPDIRATTLLLALASVVYVIITPVNIHRLNEFTGVPNIASPSAYSFLTASCATSLTMITRWREEESESRRRRMRRIHLIYAGITVALWVTFFLAHAPAVRIYDLDTYYASTPWMREHILLYLAAHTASCFVASSMLWKWSPAVTNRWLKSGVVLLQLGFASGLVYDAIKFCAIVARWCGTDWDHLSTRVAPPFALLQGVLTAIGFIVPQIGPFLLRRARDRRDYRCLLPLWRALRTATPSAATARLGRWAPLDLLLLQREQQIHDALRLLAPHIDRDLHRLAHQLARSEHDEDRAIGLAGAVAVTVAVERHRAGQRCPTDPVQVNADISNHIHDISRAMHHPRTIDTLRRRVSRREGVNTHA
ncbi:MAB_1171c family putative transporter [Streptomyces sp. NPDC059816]|uniref:MAB_1171c family putative transporter n=1 Tax=Streptomyces sp. NPDC059816 TaxID=3346960 RepID=UPI0036503254